MTDDRSPGRVEAEAPGLTGQNGLHRGRLGSGLVLVALGAITAIMHFRAASPSAGPVVVADEFGYLGSARYLARAGDSIDASNTPYYSPGFSVLAAIPARVHRGDPAATYLWTIALNACLSALAVVLAAVLAARLMRSSLITAAAGAFVAGLLPALRFNSSVGIAEPWLTMLVPVSIASVGVIAADLGRSERARAAICLFSGVVLVWLPLTHTRVLPVAGVLGVAVVLNLLVRRAWARIAWFLGGAVVMAVTSQLLVRSTRRAVWRDLDDVHAEAAVRVAVTTRRGLWETAQVVVGQSWSLVVGTAGFAALGVAMLVGVVARPRPGGVVTTGAPSWLRALVRSPARLTCLAALAALLAELTVSAAFMAGGFVRDGGLPEMFVYGRYLDMFTPFLIATGAAGIAAIVFRSPTGAPSLIVVVVAFAALFALGLVADVVSDDEFATGWFNPFSSLNVAPFGTDIAGGTWDTARVMGWTLVIGLAARAAVRRWAGATVRTFFLTALLVPSALAFDARGDDSTWLVDQLRSGGESARAMSQRIAEKHPSEVWLDGTVPLGDRLVIEWWTPTLRTERTAAGCPGNATADAVLIYASNAPRESEFAREGGLGAIACA